jgi:riboflavin synthase
MFTGIINFLGRVAELSDGSGRDLVVATDMPLDDLAIGASVAHSGICLTVVDKAPRRYRVQASGETLARTTLGRWRPGQRLNLERSLRLGDELGGHLVFGHVDAVGSVRRLERVAESWRLEVAMPPELAPLVAVKGSIAVDGVSLTVNEALPDGLVVNIIPHTWAHTTLGDLGLGDPVNLEVDMLARYVARQLAVTRQA